MTDNGNDFTGLNYELLVEDSLRLVVRAALRITEETGLPGETHFYISFLTGFPGVEMEDRLRAQHPESITIVIQHQYADLVVEDDKFSITLFFGGKPSAMTVPFAAVTSFNDPSVGAKMMTGTTAIRRQTIFSRPARLRTPPRLSRSTAFASLRPEPSPLSSG